VKTIVIAGAGIIGLSTALELAARGCRVTVLERGRVLKESSWAAAGMLAAADPENPPALAEISRYSVALYPDFLAHLRKFTGRAVALRTTRTLQICDAAQVPASAEILSSAEAVRRIPGLNLRSGQRALWLDEQSLDPRELGQALALAVRSAGVELWENTPVLSALRQGQQVDIVSPQGQWTAGALVVATGAWSASPSSDKAGSASLHTLAAGSVLPRKGQMVRLREPDGTHLTIVLRSPKVYIVPRSDGSLIVGATVEDDGFNRAIRSDATAWLLHEAAQLWSPLAQTSPEQIEEVWTGIRPGTPDHLPILGRFHDPQVFFATGHYRNGILLAPGTARVIAQLVCDEPLAIDLAPFRPERFEHPECATAEMLANTMAR
jgi:glycine oxidase